MQLRNLIYSSIKTSIEHFPYFIPNLLLALLLLLLFSGTILFFMNKFRDKKYFGLLISASSYLSVAILILISDFLSKLGISFNISISCALVTILIISFIGYWKSKLILFTFFKNILKTKYKLFFFTTLTIFSTFLLSKFTFDNGLHDEYQHHAAVEDMIRTQHFPIRDEMRYMANLSDYYHYGWYFFVILVKSIFPIDIEIALDIAKIFFFIPIQAIIYFSLSLFFKKLNFWEKTFFSTAFLFQGPALFFFDYYSRNVLFGQSNIVVYEPIFFQMAGITWFGVVYCLVFILFFQFLLQSKNKFLVGLFLFFSLYSQFLLNKAFLLLLIFSYGLIIFIHNWKIVKKLVFKNVFSMTLSISILLFIVFCLLLLIHLFEPLLFTSIFKTGEIPFVRAVDKWGFPYMNGSKLTFMSILDPKIIFSFGLLPFIGLIIMIYQIYRRQKLGFMLFSILTFSFVLPYFINFSGGELAFNKYFMVIMSVSLLAVISLYINLKGNYKKLLVFYISTGVLLPIMYFSSLTLRGYQIYWGKTDQIIEFLDKKDDVRPLVIAIDDFEYGKILLNNLNVELISSKVIQQFIDNYSKTNIDYYVVKEEVDEAYLVKTDINFLYEK